MSTDLPTPYELPFNPRYSDQVTLIFLDPFFHPLHKLFTFHDHYTLKTFYVKLACD